MIDFAWFDIALLAAAAFGYVVRPERVRGVFHDPISGALLAGGLGAADVGAAAAAPVAAAALAPELAGGIGASIALPEVSVIAPAVGAGIGGEAAAGGAAAALGAGLGASELAGSATSLFGGSPSVVGSPTSTFGDQMQPGSLPEIGAAGAAPVTSAPIAAPSGPSAASFGVSAPTTMPATSATPLASATGGGVPAADATQVAMAPSGGVSTPATAATAQPGVGTTNAATTAAKATAPADIGSKIIDFAKKNPGLLLSAAPALLSMFGKPSQVPGQAQLQNAQEQAASMGKTLSAYQLSGTLPPGMQQVVDAKNAADKAGIRSNFAQLGYTGSTAEHQQLEQADRATAGQIALIGAQLASQGLDWTHISQQELETLLNAQLKQQSDFSAAIGNLAKGLVPIGSAVDKAIAQ
jgi:hypothetical protein